MKKILLVCMFMTFAQGAYGQSQQDLARVQASPEAAKAFSDIGFYMGILNHCGTPVDMQKVAPLVRRFNRAQQARLFASIDEGQARVNALPVFDYVAGTTPCLNARADYERTMERIETFFSVMQRR